MIWFRLAFRNVFRHRRRSLLTIAALAVGFTAVNLFEGYTADTLTGLGQAAIHAEALGHLVVFKRDALTKGRIDEEKYTLTGAELATMTRALAGIQGLERIVPKLEVSGLVTNGRVSVIFIADAIEPADYDAMSRGFSYRGQGTALTAANPGGGQMASGLAEILGFTVGDVATIFSTTLAGQMNAVDLPITGVANSGSTATNDKYIRMPLSVARSLYATDGAQRVALLLDSSRPLAAVQQDVVTALTRGGLDVEVRTWQEMSAFYQSVANLFGTIFGFLFLIVLIVVVMGVLNTMTMAVMERTREVGALRAIGLRRRGVLTLFSVEALVLSGLGIGAGYLMTIGAALLIRAADIHYVPPGSSDSVTLAVTVLPALFAFNGVVLTMFSVVAAFFPARRAYRLGIVDALGHT